MVWDGAFNSLSMGFSSLAVRSSGIAGGRSWPTCPRAWNFGEGGSYAAWAARLTGRNPIEQEGRDARTPGEPEASLAALLRSSIIIILSQEYLDRFILRKI